MKRAIRSKTVEVDVNFVFDASPFPRPFISMGRRTSVSAFECLMMRQWLAVFDCRFDGFAARSGMFVPHVQDIEIYRGREKIAELKGAPHA